MTALKAAINSPCDGEELWQQLLFAQEQYEEIIGGFDEIEEGKAQPIVLGFIKDPTLNAFAATSRRSSFIGLNYGTWVRFCKFAALLFADSRCFRNIGNPDLEQVLPDFYVQHDWVQGKIKVHAGPRDYIRRQAAYYIAFAALDFVFYHELWHVKLGHVIYRQLNDLGVLIGELPRATDPGHVIDQIMELQADGSAAFTMFKLCQRTQDAYLASVGTILAIVLLGCGRGLRTVEDFTDLSHPHPAVRLHCLRVNFDSEVGDTSERAKNTREAYLTAERDCLTAFRTLQISSLADMGSLVTRNAKRTYDEMLPRSRHMDELLRDYLWEQLPSHLRNALISEPELILRIQRLVD